jgi:glucose-6-phosphate 1-dehydrogenase
VRQIRVTLTERQGIEGRGAFYDATGVLRDVVQNHALESLAAALASDASSSAARLEVLQRLALGDLLERAVREGQYAGYLAEPGVAEGSRTATALELSLTYAGETGPVPLTITAGKALAQSEQALTIIAKGTSTLSLVGSEAYERLMNEALAGDRHYFVSFEEVLAAWRLVDPVQAALPTLPLIIYERGSSF